jgi:hypothetical protein
LLERADEEAPPRRLKYCDQQQQGGNCDTTNDVRTRMWRIDPKQIPDEAHGDEDDAALNCARNFLRESHNERILSTVPLDCSVAMTDDVLVVPTTGRGCVASAQTPTTETAVGA